MSVCIAIVNCTLSLINRQPHLILSLFVYLFKFFCLSLWKLMWTCWIFTETAQTTTLWASYPTSNHLYTDVITKAAHSPQLSYDTECWSGLGFETSTSRSAARPSAYRANQVAAASFLDMLHICLVKPCDCNWARLFSRYQRDSSFLIKT